MYLPKRRKNIARKIIGKPDREKGSNQPFYKSAQWKKVRQAYLNQFPLCQVAEYCDDIIEGKIVDHIIPIELGGAKYDPRNFQTLSKRIHDTKSGLERHNGILVDYTINENGDKIPVDKEDVWKYLKNRYLLQQKGAIV